MAKKQFKAESKRLLDLMVNSIYTHKEIFLRELISNASDALDKLYYSLLTNNVTGVGRDEFFILIELDREARTLTVRDNGQGMTRSELEQNLGTIARSGSLEFKRGAESRDDVDIIGQFGVGFYASFMVADHVTVVSRAYGAEEAWRWQSDGSDGYAVEPCVKDGHGTDITLHIKPDADGESYDEFLESHRIQLLVKKYSDYIRYPIRMELEHRHPKEGSAPEFPEYETHTELETLNSMVPIWKKLRNELADDDYNSFYKEKFYDFENPLKVIHSSAEGAATYSALLFIPARAPYDFYTREYEKGLQLYASGVLIMDKCPDLLPDYFGFVRGLVDSSDLSLNISRELLQHDRQLKTIASRLEKKIKSELEQMLAGQREKYEKFFEQFGLTLKYGIYSGYGQHKETLQNLLLFRYSGDSATTTLAEYVSRMPEGQKYIYYACGESAQRAMSLPQAETVLDRGYELLCLTDDVDEFALKMLGGYDGHEFRSVSGQNPELNDGAADTAGDGEHSALFAAMSEALDGKVTLVRASKRLKTHPVCLASDGALSLEMEKVLNAMPQAGGAEKVKAERVLEVNEGHPVFEALRKAYDRDRALLATYARLLYAQALLTEDMPVDDPAAFSGDICELMTRI